MEKVGEFPLWLVAMFLRAEERLEVSSFVDRLLVVVQGLTEATKVEHGAAEVAMLVNDSETPSPIVVLSQS